MSEFLLTQALSNDEFDCLWDQLNPERNPWRLNNFSVVGDETDRQVSWSNNDYCPLPFYRAASTIRMKSERNIKKRLTLVRIHTNGQTSNQVSKFHIDYADKGNFFSAIFFARPNWNTQWGGNFTCFDGENYKIFPYIPNNAVVIPSEWDHYGEPPSRYTCEMRVTVAFMYCLTEKLTQMAEVYPLKVVHNLK